MASRHTEAAKKAEKTVKKTEEKAEKAGGGLRGRTQKVGGDVPDELVFPAAPGAGAEPHRREISGRVP